MTHDPNNANAASTFTGRERRRKTSRMVRFADVASRLLITMGGIGTIVAVTLVCVFLVYVAAPLFKSGHASDGDALNQLDDKHGKPIHVAMNEYQLLAFEIFEDGHVLVFDLNSRTTLETFNLADGRRLTASSYSARSGQIGLGFDDGSIIVGELGFTTTFIPEEQLPPAILALEEGQTAIYEKGVIERTPTGFRLHGVKKELPAPIAPESDLPIRLLDVAFVRGDSIYAALSEDGSLRLRRVTRQTNMMTGQVRLTVTGSLLPYDHVPDQHPDYLKVTGLGDSIMLGWRDGRLLRFDTRDFDNPVLAEELNVLRDSAQTHVSATSFLIGRTTLMIGDSSGGLTAWFRVKPTPVAFTPTQQALFVASELPPHLGSVPLADRMTRPTADQVPAEFLEQRKLTLDDLRLDSTSDGAYLIAARALEAGPTAVTALAPSARGRLLAAGYANGSARVYHVTTGQTVVEMPQKVGGAVASIILAPRDNGLLAVAEHNMMRWDFNAGHPAATLNAIFGKVWYEGYEKPTLTWQSSSGTDDFEAKYSLMPLIFGTIKATIYAMMFALPLALLGAIYTSEFMHARVKAWVKPLIEIMASLPSVVLGFLAALVFAPFLETIIPATLLAFFTVPFAVLTGAFLWQLLPYSKALRIQNIGSVVAGGGHRPTGRLATTINRIIFRTGGLKVMGMFVALAAGIGLALLFGPLIEHVLFAGSVRAWLNGQVSSSVGGWVFLLMPVCAVGVAIVTVLWINPRLFSKTESWSRQAMASLSIVKFLVGTLVTLILAFGLAFLVDLVGLDPRGTRLFPPDVFNTYVQRNALVVGFAMAFAVIPIIYTIAEDALSAVPEHLRAGSLGTGATPWQTAIRIIIPTAMSGLFSAVMIGLGRAVGETMIVLMAAGNTPVMEWNIFNGFRTLSANIAVELPEAPINGTHYRMLFLAALTLFAMTFAVNTVAEIIRLRFRKRAYQL